MNVLHSNDNSERCTSTGKLEAIGFNLGYCFLYDRLQLQLFLWVLSEFRCPLHQTLQTKKQLQVHFCSYYVCLRCFYNFSDATSHHLNIIHHHFCCKILYPYILRSWERACHVFIQCSSSKVNILSNNTPPDTKCV